MQMQETASVQCIVEVGKISGESLKRRLGPSGAGDQEVKTFNQISVS
jgi:hypothetical protein